MKKRLITKNINKYVKVAKILRRTNKITKKEFNEYIDAIKTYAKYNNYKGIEDLLKPFTKGKTSFKDINKSLKDINDVTLHDMRINNFFEKNEYLLNDPTGSSQNSSNAKWAIKHLFGNDISAYDNYLRNRVRTRR